ncbi:ATP-binding protein [Actinoplanes couchii]|uniref:Histidine kinase/HSP90-like ATPase domain-containing protein n=1 Tax=Actinoplanes couchii TaxID=403638 RepID=A0ABQ3XTL7_9ACTN|nr:ATP-binding protein [Actinoplanes couchii]MDR6324124.1 anti-sigma regulatory factor (Ser/Thr protein kinase) [Actinoplanes couchii]GID61859.1 hypothetical protein Aco03nite_102630 [Actinoplanes couchii]
MSHLETFPLPLGAHVLKSWRLSSSADLTGLRANLSAALQTLQPYVPGPSDDVVDSMVLVATELATNAIRHGQPPTEVRLLRADDRLILDVADRDHHNAPRLSPERAVGDGGLGLMLARSLSLQVSWYRDGESKHIWAAFNDSGEIPGSGLSSGSV